MTAYGIDEKALKELLEKNFSILPKIKTIISSQQTKDEFYNKRDALKLIKDDLIPYRNNSNTNYSGTITGKISSWIKEQKWSYPTTIKSLSRGFNRTGVGEQHDGLDINTPVGTPIYSIGSGTVIFVGKASQYGKRIVIQHLSDPNNNKIKFISAYSHLSEYKVKEGDTVFSGTVIALSGDTGLGNSKVAAHLHFEIATTTKSGPFFQPDYIDPKTIFGKYSVTRY